MATYEITSPSGEVFEVTAPDSASEEEVMAYAKSQFDGEKKESSDIARIGENLLPSAKQFLEDIVTPFTKPKETATSMADLFFGLGDKVTGGMNDPDAQRRMQTVDTVGQFMKDRYIDNPYENFIQDPVGMGVDAIGLLAGGSSLAARAPGQVGKYAGQLNKAVSAVDPVTATARGVKGGTKLVGKGSQELLGKTTGVGAGAVERSLQRSEDFLKGLRDKNVTQETAVDAGRDLLRNLKEAKREQYVSDMAKVKAWDESLDMSTVNPTIKRLNDRYGIAVDGKGNVIGTSSSKLNKQALGEVQQVFDELNRWASNSKNRFTPSDLDVLKVRLDDIYSETSKARGYVTELRNEIKNIITKNVDGYETAMGNYQKYADLEKELSKTLSLTDKATIDTAFKKLTSTFRSNFEGRADVLNRLKEAGINPDAVLDMVAGLQMRDLSAKGLMGQMSIGGSLVGLGAGNVQFLALLASTSPRLVSEVLGALNWPKRSINKLLNHKNFKQLRKKVNGLPKTTKRVIGTPEGRAITSNVGRYTNLIEQETQDENQ